MGAAALSPKAVPSKVICDALAPPGRGDFLVSNFHPGVIPGNLVRNDFWR